MNFRENIILLRTLSDDYYQNRIMFAEYREKRSQLLKLIDEDLNGVTIYDEKENVEESLIDKALSFLKIDKVKETN